MGKNPPVRRCNTQIRVFHEFCVAPGSLILDIQTFKSLFSSYFMQCFGSSEENPLLRFRKEHSSVLRKFLFHIMALQKG